MDTINPVPQASSGVIIDTATQRIVAALFSRRADAVEAISNLKHRGFPDANIDLFVADDLQQESPETTADGRHTSSTGAGTGGLVRALTALGISEDVASYYETDVRAGMSLITVIANERSVDALNILQGQGGEEMGSEEVDRETHEALQSVQERPVPDDMSRDVNSDQNVSTVDEIRKMAR